MQSIAVAVSVAVSGGTPAFALAGGGSESTNVILSTTSAYLQGGSLGTTTNKVGSVTITATSGGKVEALVLAVAAAVSFGGTTAVGVALGVSVARNFIGWDPDGSTSYTYLSTQHPATVTTGQRVKIPTPAAGAASMPAYARSGDVYEYIGTTPLTGSAYDYLSTATVTGGIVAGTRVKAGGSVYRYDPAFDYVSTQTVSGGIAVNTLVLRDGRIYKRTGSALSGTVNLATQTYTTANGWTLQASPVNLSLENYADTAKWAPVPDGVDLVSMDYSDTTLWKLVGVDRTGAVVEAAVKNASIHATGALTLTATSTQTIDATVAAGAVAVSGGGSTGVGVSGAGAYAENRIATDVQAKIDGDGATGIHVASLNATATDSSGIRALVGAASIAAGLGGSTGVAISIGLSIAINQVDNRTEAAIVNAGDGVITDTGGVTLLAQTLAKNLFTFGTTATLTAAQLDNAAVADSDDLTTTGAGNDEAANDAAVDAPILAALATAFAAGGYTLTAGWKLDVIRAGSVWKVTDGTPLLGGCYPGICRSFVITLSGGTFTVSAPTIEVVSAAASLAVGIGGSTGVAIAGAGAVALNSVTSHTNAHIDDSVVTSHTGISLTATATNAISATVLAVAAAVGAGGSAGIGVAIGISIAKNLIGETLDGTPSPTQIQAYALRSTLTAQGGALTATATASHAINAIVIAASVALAAGGSAGVGVAAQASTPRTTSRRTSRRSSTAAAPGEPPRARSR